MSSQSSPAQPDRRWLILGVLGLAQLMVVLDGTIVNIALPSAQATLHFSNSGRQWVVTAYALSFGSLLLLGGRTADIFGRRRVFLIGLTGFALASAVGGAAGNLATLLAARAIQGAFAALLAPALLALLTTTFVKPDERSKAFGVFGGIAGAGAAIGLLLGGFLTQYLSWRWCFFINLFLAMIAFAGGAWLLDRRHVKTPVSLDLPGTITVTSGLFFIVFGFARAETDGWTAASTLASLGLGVLLLAAFLVIQSRSSHPLLPLRVLTNRNRAGAYLATFMVGMGMFGVFLFLTFYIQTILHFSAVKAGLAFVPMSLMIIAASSLGSVVLSTRFSAKVMIPAGMTIAAAGLILFTRIAVHGSYVHHVLPASLLFGLGLGTVFGFASNTATRGARPEDTGVTSAMVNVAQQVGAAIGTALLSTIASSAAAKYLHEKTGPPQLVKAEAAVHGYSVGFWAAAVIFLVGAVLTWLLLDAVVPSKQPVTAPA
jgi:EmrB/QacA subfamily drug resistance transporter